MVMFKVYKNNISLFAVLTKQATSFLLMPFLVACGDGRNGIITVSRVITLVLLNITNRVRNYNFGDDIHRAIHLFNLDLFYDALSTKGCFVQGKDYE